MKVAKGLDITRESWEVLKQDRELLVFPACSTIAAMTIIATIGTAGFLIPEFGRWMLTMLDEDSPHTLSEYALGVVCLFALYFVQWFIVVFFNTALVGCALIRFSGGAPTVKDGFRIARQRLPQIIAWALFTSAVGTILSATEQKLGWLGKFIVRSIGMAWAVSTYFVVPVLAAEGTGPITAVRRSVTLLKKSWGEGLTGNIAIRLISTGITTLLVLAGVTGIMVAVYFGSIVMAGVTLTLLLAVFLIVFIVSSALRQIFLAGLYEYANTGNVPRGFSEHSMRHALMPAE